MTKQPFRRIDRIVVARTGRWKRRGAERRGEDTGKLFSKATTRVGMNFHLCSIGCLRDYRYEPRERRVRRRGAQVLSWRWLRTARETRENMYTTCPAANRTSYLRLIAIISFGITSSVSFDHRFLRFSEKESSVAISWTFAWQWKLGNWNWNYGEIKPRHEYFNVSPISLNSCETFHNIWRRTKQGIPLTVNDIKNVIRKYSNL